MSDERTPVSGARQAKRESRAANPFFALEPPERYHAVALYPPALLAFPNGQATLAVRLRGVICPFDAVAVSGVHPAKGSECGFWALPLEPPYPRYSDCAIQGVERFGFVPTQFVI